VQLLLAQAIDGEPPLEQIGLRKRRLCAPAAEPAIGALHIDRKRRRDG
jgi:hypothetical protein